MSLLREKEIIYIENEYRKYKSISKTAKITGYSKNTVNKYVKHISSLDKRSRDCKNEVYQINLQTGDIIREWNKPYEAAKELNINAAEICRVLKGELHQAGGFGWKNKRK